MSIAQATQSASLMVSFDQRVQGSKQPVRSLPVMGTPAASFHQPKNCLCRNTAKANSAALKQKRRRFSRASCLCAVVRSVIRSGLIQRIIATLREKLFPLRTRFGATIEDDFLENNLRYRDFPLSYPAVFPPTLIRLLLHTLVD